ncbi:uncharacterized N-acetyltransferase C9.02c-like isoform X1 [Asterias rubens]|uniref:uncharacterized N-acetyltransferase C9.02c-like isoform X1 n=1 Tax=Asterias rubens TaxID=7604 RepID=UPI0014553217|nr:uncharacterized N-acetyltransferase C9.02c-like isoform X1 [Asterias rubens]
MSNLNTADSIRRVTGYEVHDAWLLEARCFPSDETASKETLEYRQREAPELFWVYFKDSCLIGLICCTQAPDKLTHESMYKHTPEGKTVCVHSVAVDQEHQRQGIATSLLKHLLQHVQENFDKVTKVSLLCHDKLKLLYEKVGFQCRGLSEVVHGPRPWFDMEYSISH